MLQIMKKQSVIKFIALSITLFLATWGTVGTQSMNQAAHSAFPEPFLVKNIATDPLGSGPSYMAEFNGLIYFNAAYGEYKHYGLFRSDGTDEGTEMVKIDIYPMFIHPIKDRFFFFEQNRYTSDVNLWVSDGTEAGTKLIMDGAVSYGDYPIIDDQIYFVAGSELWKSDGTESGTLKVKGFWGGLGEFTNVGGTMFFSAQDRDHGTELWKSDGTGSGTVMVKDIYTVDSEGSSPEELTDVDGTLFFSARDGTHGFELWKSDGTSSGTAMVKDIIPDESSSYPSQFVNFLGDLFFVADGTELWKSDGTESGTTKIKEFSGGNINPSLTGLTVVDDTLFFAANDGTHGIELWKSNGTLEGTTLVRDIITGESDGMPYDEQISSADGIVFFQADDGIHGLELWLSDGTKDGTIMVQDIFSGAESSEPLEMFAYNDLIYFSADDGLHGRELWKSDGTASGTRMVKDINISDWGTPIKELTAVKDVLFFSASDFVSGIELWKSDGTDPGTNMVKDIYQDEPGPWVVHYPTNLTSVSDELFFMHVRYYVGDWDPRNYSGALWKSDGTEAGTVEIYSNFSWGYMEEYLSQMIDINGTAFFNAGSPLYGLELWKSDGSTGGTGMVKDIDLEDDIDIFGDWGAKELTKVDNTLFFATSDRTHGWELWKSDGTETGTLMVKDIYPDAEDSNPSFLTNINSVLYFSADDGMHGNELWRSDGTTEGTIMVMDISPEADSSNPMHLTNVNGVLYFTASDGVHGVELWKSDGTSEGTTMVKDICPGVPDSAGEKLAAVNDILYFEANDCLHAYELWKSDGTVAGTVLVKDINPGVESASIDQLTAVNNLLYFVADDGGHGKELWISNGSEHGTLMIKDIYAGSDSATPGDLTQVGDKLFFSAEDGVHGREPWAVTIPGYIPERTFLPRVLKNARSCEENFSKTNVWEGELNWACDSTEKKEGANSIRLETEVFSDAEVYSNLIPVKPDQTYKVSYWVKTDMVVDTANVYGRVVAAQYNNLAQENDAIYENRIDVGFSLGENAGGETDWVLKSYTFTTDSKAYTVRLRAPMGLGGRAKGQVWFDGVKIEVVE